MLAQRTPFECLIPLFIDRGGNDTYARTGGQAMPGNGRRWFQHISADPRVTTELGAGIDSATGALDFDTW